MARSGLTKAQVRACRETLLAQGSYPSADAVRRALGDTGSKSTIHRYLKELAGEEVSAVGRDDTARTLLALVEQLAERLHDDAEKRVCALREQHALALAKKEAELAALRARIVALEGRPVPPAPPPGERPSSRASQGIGGIGGIGGFGRFSGPLSDSRGGRQDSSPFSIVLAGGRTDVFDFDGGWPLAGREGGRVPGAT